MRFKGGKKVQLTMEEKRMPVETKKTRSPSDVYYVRTKLSKNVVRNVTEMSSSITYDILHLVMSQSSTERKAGRK